jgi:hypothetical protein
MRAERSGMANGCNLPLRTGRRVLVQYVPTVKNSVLRDVALRSVRHITSLTATERRISRKRSACERWCYVSEHPSLATCVLLVSVARNGAYLSDVRGVVMIAGVLFFFKARSQNCGKGLLTSSCMSVRTEQHGFHLTGFHEIWCLSILLKSVEKIQVLL